MQVQNKLQRLKVAEEKRKQTEVPVSPDSVYLVPGTTDVPEPDSDTQQEQEQQRRPAHKRNSVRSHGQGAGPRKRHSSARGTALQMMGRLGPYGRGGALIRQQPASK